MYLTGYVDKHVSDRRGLELLGKVAVRLQVEDEYRVRYKRYVGKYTFGADRYLRLADAYQKWGELEKAIESMRSALVSGVDNPALRRAQLARMYQRKGLNKEAIDEVDCAIYLEPGNELYYSMKAELLCLQGKNDDAVKVLGHAIEDDLANSVVLRVELARIYTKIGRVDDGLAQLDMAIAESPEREADIQYLKAHFYISSGLMEKAESALERALVVNPNYAPANNDLGYAWVDRDENLERAKVMIRKALDSAPDSAVYLDSMGWVEYKFGRFDKAIELLYRAVRRPGGNNPVTLDHLGDALWRAGYRKQAAAQWKKAIVELKKGQGDHGDQGKLECGVVEKKIEKAVSGGIPDVASVPNRSVIDDGGGGIGDVENMDEGSDVEE